jgi:SAM-dependent methyltransferase
MSRSDPYAEIARFYDAEFAAATADVRTFFQDLEGCRRVLVLGCGTGRVSEGLRCPGREIVGVDISQPMIERARAIGAGGESPPVTYVVADMCALPDLGRFDAAVVPNAAFSFLPTRRAQLQCLQGLRARVDGPVWIDVPMPDFTLLGQGHTPEAVASESADAQGGWTRTREVFRFPVEQRLLLRDRYYVNFDADDAWQGAVPDHVSDLALRLIFPAELEWMLETAGFYADRLYGDHAGSPVREGCDRLLVRAL